MSDRFGGTAAIYAALADVMDEVKSVAKRDRNETQGFSFRGIDATVNAVGPALRKHRVTVIPEVLSHTFGTVEVGRNRTPMGHVIVQVAYTFYATDGSHVAACVLGEAMDSGDKAVSKAMSVAMRTALLQSLALPTDEPEPDGTVYERSAEPSEAETLAAKEAEELKTAKHYVMGAWKLTHDGQFDVAAMTADYEQYRAAPLADATEGDLNAYADELIAAHKESATETKAEEAKPDV